MTNGFRKSGLFPFDANAVDYSKCVKDHIQKTITAMPLSALSSDSSLSVLRSYFTYIDECIGDEKTLLFRSVHGREWLGDIEDTSLFQLWSSIKLQLDESSVNTDICMTTPPDIPPVTATPLPVCMPVDGSCHGTPHVLNTPQSSVAVTSPQSSIALSAVTTPQTSIGDPSDITQGPCTSQSLRTSHRLQSSITPVLTKHLSEWLQTLEKKDKAKGTTRKRPLSSSVYALTSKRWKQLQEEEIAEKERQKQEKKKKS